MRKFQRVAVVAAAVAGLSTFGVGVSFANDGFDGVTAVASSQANAVANYGGGSEGQGHPGPQGAPVFAPENGGAVNYGQEHGPEQGPDHGPDHGPDNGYDQ